MIEKLTHVPDGSDFEWVSPDGVYFPSQTEYLTGEYLGFCGCGDPIAVMEYVGNFLTRLENGDYGDYEDMPYMFLCYWANDKNYAEHGTTARCSWLTPLGKELLKDIRVCLENENTEKK